MGTPPFSAVWPRQLPLSSAPTILIHWSYKAPYPCYVLIFCTWPCFLLYRGNWSHLAETLNTSAAPYLLLHPSSLHLRESGVLFLSKLALIAWPSNFLTCPWTIVSSAPFLTLETSVEDLFSTHSFKTATNALAYPFSVLSLKPSPEFSTFRTSSVGGSHGNVTCDKLTYLSSTKSVPPCVLPVLVHSIITHLNHQLGRKHLISPYCLTLFIHWSFSHISVFFLCILYSPSSVPSP